MEPIKESCSRRVYSGDRLDFSGHQCENPAKVLTDGKAWCTVHDPARVRARKESQDKAWTDARAEQLAVQDEAKVLADRLGGGTCYFQYAMPGKKSGYRRALVIPFELAEKLAATSEALAEVLKLFPEAAILDVLDDGSGSGGRYAPIASCDTPRARDVRRWRGTLSPAGKEAPG